MTKRAAWGILGTGGIAHVFAEALAATDSSRLAAVASRNLEKSRAFAAEFGVDTAYGTYDELLADPAIEFAYIATPHHKHVELAVAAAASGKHVLCEKPIGVTAAGAELAIDAARAAGVFLMEAFAFRLHPQTVQLAELLEGGEIGELRMMKLDWGFDAGPNPNASYYYRRDLAGGAILDNGCYTVSVAGGPAGTTVGSTYRDPASLYGAGLLHPDDGIHLDAQALLWWEGGTSAAISASFRTNIDKTIRLTGTTGFILLPAPYLPLRPDRFGGDPLIIIEREGQPPREIRIDVTQNAYTIEADRVVAYAREGRTEAPEYPWDDILGNMRTLDRWREAVGVHLPMDDEAAAGRPC